MQSARLLAVALLFAPPLAAQPVAESEPLTVVGVNEFVELVFSTPLPALRADAAGRYLWMIGRLGEPLEDGERDIIAPHIRFMSLVMPESDPLKAVVERMLTGGPAPPGSGERLVSWWHRQDQVPATEGNERLEEHLSRVEFALRAYPSADDPLGVDDRGEVFVRLGEPTTRRAIRLLTPSLSIHPYMSRLPRNEFWVFREIDDAAHFLFVQPSAGQPYELGIAIDLIPPQLRTGRRKTRLLLTVMDEIFGQLALEHPHYGAPYESVSEYVTLPPIGSQPPHIFARTALDASRSNDLRHTRIRDREVPTAHWNAYGDAAALEVSARWARFLGDDGGTRVELYWGVELESLRPRRRSVNRLRRAGHLPSEDYLLSVHVAQKASDWRTTYVGAETHVVPAGAAGLRAFVIASRLDSDSGHFAAQFDQRWTSADSAGERLPGALLKMATMTVDSVDALRTGAYGLEMSDLKPTFSDGTLYPFRDLVANDPITLYFELYHLAVGADRRSRYRVETGVASLAGDGRRIGTASPYESNTPVTRETVELDLSAWDDSGPIRVTVRVTDEITGSVVERSLDFRIAR